MFTSVPPTVNKSLSSDVLRRFCRVVTAWRDKCVIHHHYNEDFGDRIPTWWIKNQNRNSKFSNLVDQRPCVFLRDRSGEGVEQRGEAGQGHLVFLLLLQMLQCSVNHLCHEQRRVEVGHLVFLLLLLQYILDLKLYPMLSFSCFYNLLLTFT